MPELPDIELYVHKLSELVIGDSLVRLRLYNPFVLRSVNPPPASLEERQVTGVSRIGKRIALEFDGDLYAVVHLMIAGRLQWTVGNSKRVGGKIGAAAFEFGRGTLSLTEAGSKKRASITLVEGRQSLGDLDPGGLEAFESSIESFAQALRSENRTLKRGLTSPHLFSGIGNAYSDEILHSARLSPMRLTRSLKDEEVERLYHATRTVLADWRERLKAQFANRFPGPGDVTAFRPEFAVHGKFGQRCPVCGKPVQRIRYAENEANYCAVCQNEGRLLADRALSRLLKGDWPKTLEELEG